MKILVLVNTLQNVSSFIYSNHIEFFVTAAKKDPSIEFIFYTPHRMTIDTARNLAAKFALEQSCDYLMFIDDDVMIPNDTLDKLLKANKDIIAGLVIIRGMPFNNMAFKYSSTNHLVHYNDLPLVEPCAEGHNNYDISCTACRQGTLQELVKVDAIGFSCCLIKTEVLKNLEPPYFITGPNNTEDIFFCIKVQTELDPPPEIYLHVGVECGHLLNPEPIEWRTRRKMIEFYKEALPEDFSRNDTHIEKCLAKIL